MGNPALDALDADLLVRCDRPDTDIARAHRRCCADILIADHSFATGRNRDRDDTDTPLKDVARIVRVMLRLKARHGDGDAGDNRGKDDPDDARHRRTGRRRNPVVTCEQIAGDAEHDEKANGCGLPSAEWQRVSRGMLPPRGTEKHEPNAQQQSADEGRKE